MNSVFCVQYYFTKAARRHWDKDTNIRDSNVLCDNHSGRCTFQPNAAKKQWNSIVSIFESNDICFERIQDASGTQAKKEAYTRREMAKAHRVWHAVLRLQQPEEVALSHPAIISGQWSDFWCIWTNTATTPHTMACFQLEPKDRICQLWIPLQVTGCWP